MMIILLLSVNDDSNVNLKDLYTTCLVQLFRVVLNEKDERVEVSLKKFFCQT